MNVLKKILIGIITIALIYIPPPAKSQEHEVLFCGEKVPISNSFVANKLMDIIRRQIPNVNLPSLRSRALQYMPYVAGYLRSMGLPEDFKYLPIVESGFALMVSAVGARGFWQIMPGTGTDKGLVQTQAYDERDDFQKSTIAACKVLLEYYRTLQRLNNISSWVMTAAAYNWGIGNVSKAIKTKGTDYFTMNLNPETAGYVYKIIAVKELFEYPELYMKSFGYNIFSATAKKPKTPITDKIDESAFTSLSITVPTKISETKTKIKSVFVTAHITGKYKNFRDGEIVSLILNEDLYVQGGYSKKGTTIKGAGWIIDDRIYVDLGYGHELTLCDATSTKGIPLNRLTKNEPILLKNDIFDDKAQWK